MESKYILGAICLVELAVIYFKSQEARYWKMVANDLRQMIAKNIAIRNKQLQKKRLEELEKQL